MRVLTFIGSQICTNSSLSGGILHRKQLMIKEIKDLVQSNTISDFEDSYLSPELPDSKDHVLFAFSKCF